MDGKAVVLSGGPATQEIQGGMAPSGLVGVAGTGQVDHIRRHVFACGKSRSSCPYEHAQAHEQGHEQGQRLSQCFHRVTSLKWPQKKHIALDVLLTAGFCLRSKKERRAMRSPPHPFYLQSCGFLKESASPNIFFFRLFRWYEGVRCGEGEQRKHQFPANRRTAPLVVDYLSKLRWRLR